MNINKANNFGRFPMCQEQCAAFSIYSIIWLYGMSVFVVVVVVIIVPIYKWEAKNAKRWRLTESEFKSLCKVSMLSYVASMYTIII